MQKYCVVVFLYKIYYNVKMKDLQKLLTEIEKIHASTEQRNLSIIRMRVYQFFIIYGFVCYLFVRIVLRFQGKVFFNSILFSIILNLLICVFCGVLFGLCQREIKLLKADNKTDRHISNSLLKEYSVLKRKTKLSPIDNKVLEARTNRIYILER